MKPYLIEQVKRYLPAGIIGALGYLSLKLLDLIIYPMLPGLYKRLDTKSALLLVLLSSVIILALLLLLIKFWVESKEYKLPEPTIHYGVYWDYMYQPLCPSCKAPLHQEELTRLQLISGPPKLICPNGHFNEYLIAGGEKLYPDGVRYDFLKINKMLIKNEDE